MKPFLHKTATTIWVVLGPGFAVPRHTWVGRYEASG
jgi:hypothetical protein